MKLRKLLYFITLTMLLVMPSIPVYALGSPTPLNQIHAGMFPVGSTQTVDYCHFLNVRRGPAPTYASFTTLARGTQVTVLEFSRAWVRVDTAQGQGWIYAGFLSRGSASASAAASPGGAVIGGRTPFSLLRADMFPAGSTATVDFASHVNVRRGPGNNYSAFTHVARGDVITILGYYLGWARLNTPSGEGWMFAGFLMNDAVRAARASNVAPAAGGGGRAALGSPTPVSQLSAAMFPVGSFQTVDYAHFLNVRRGPGVNHAAFNHLARGDVITVLEYRGGWVRVDTNRGQGWIFAGYLRRGGGQAAAAAPAAAGGYGQAAVFGNLVPSGAVSGLIVERIREADAMWDLAHIQVVPLMRNTYLGLAADLYGGAAWALENAFLTDTVEYRHVIDRLNSIR